MRKGSAEAERKQSGGESGLRRHVQCEEIHIYSVQISVNKTETATFRVITYTHKL